MSQLHNLTAHGPVLCDVVELLVTQDAGVRCNALAASYVKLDIRRSSTWFTGK